MTYSPHSLITYNLAQLRRHMLNQGCTPQQWEAALWHAIYTEHQEQDIMPFAPRDPENLDPFGPQNGSVG